MKHVFFKKLNPDAEAPTREYSDAGYDLYLSEEFLEIGPGERKIAKTGISIQIPEGFYGHISDRSGNAFKKGVHCLGKIIDPSYRGEVGVILYNTSTTTPAIFHKGNRVAQIIFKKFETPVFVEVQNLEDSQRGIGGFGSTGQ